MITNDIFHYTYVNKEKQRSRFVYFNNFVPWYFKCLCYNEFVIVSTVVEFSYFHCCGRLRCLFLLLPQWGFFLHVFERFFICQHSGIFLPGLHTSIICHLRTKINNIMLLLFYLVFYILYRIHADCFLFCIYNSCFSYISFDV